VKRFLTLALVLLLALLSIAACVLRIVESCERNIDNVDITWEEVK